MIYDALDFLRHRLDAYISGNRSAAEPVMVLSNPWTSNDNNKNFSFLNSLSLINIEEDRTFKTQLPVMVRQKDHYLKQPPDLKINLYILISAYNKKYEDALKLISKVVSYFQVNTVFQNRTAEKKDDIPLPDSIDKLIVELYTPSFEQQNQIWASLSTGYLPSVIYKVRMLLIDADTRLQETVPDIRQIHVKLDQGVS
jgi:Pvc16 N-terminal domain